MGELAQGSTRWAGYDGGQGDRKMRRIMIPILAFVAGAALMTGIYLGLLS